MLYYLVSGALKQVHTVLLLKQTLFWTHEHAYSFQHLKTPQDINIYPKTAPTTRIFIITRLSYLVWLVCARKYLLMFHLNHYQTSHSQFSHTSHEELTTRYII